MELVDSVDDLKSSCSIKRNSGPDFELLDARIASALNKIIQNTRFKKKVSLEEQKAQKEDRFLRRKTDRLPPLRYFRVTGANDSVENFMQTYLQLFFEMMIFRNSIRNGTKFYCR